MNYKQKYLKYKNKYLQLKQQGGLNLSGPIIIDYYKHKTNGKKIIIIGDKHWDKSKICNTKIDTIEINKYFELLFDQSTDLKFNAFIEMNIPNKHNLETNNIIINNEGYKEGYLGDIIKLSIDNYNKNENKKIYFSDIRENIKGYDDYDRGMENIIELLKNIGNFKNDYNLLKIFDWQPYIATLYKFFFQLKPYYDNIKIGNDYKINNDEDIPKYLIDEMLEFNDKNQLASLLNIILLKIAKCVSDIDTTINFINLENISSLNKIQNIGHEIAIYITDLYTVLKIMNNNLINNSIIFGGVLHSNSFNEYLTISGFDLIYQKFSNKNENQEEFRCVKDIIDFKTFFTS